MCQSDTDVNFPGAERVTDAAACSGEIFGGNLHRAKKEPPNESGGWRARCS
jgi:hypothetical protein